MGGKSRTNHLANQLGAAGVHEKQFRLVGHGAIGLAMLQRVTNLLTDRGSTGLANDPDDSSQCAKTLREELNLCRFSSAFRALKADEKSLQQADVSGPLLHGNSYGWASSGWADNGGTNHGGRAERRGLLQGASSLP